MEWAVAGITYEWSAAWWQAWGAILQAVLTAGAVFAASVLQDRGLAKRDEALRNQRLDGIAAVARYVNSMFDGVSTKVQQGMHPTAVREVFPGGCLNAAVRAMREVEPAQIGDLQLTSLFLRLEHTLEIAHTRVFDIINRAELASRNGTTVKAQSILGATETEVFNAASAVERRVAELVRRRAEL